MELVLAPHRLRACRWGCWCWYWAGVGGCQAGASASPAPSMTAGVAGVGAAGDGGDHHRAVAEAVRLPVQGELLSVRETLRGQTVALEAHLRVRPRGREREREMGRAQTRSGVRGRSDMWTLGQTGMSVHLSLSYWHTGPKNSKQL